MNYSFHLFCPSKTEDPVTCWQVASCLLSPINVLGWGGVFPVTSDNSWGRPAAACPSGAPQPVLRL